MTQTIETNDFHIDFLFADTLFAFDGVRLYQVGKKFCNSKTVVETHAHIDWFEVTVILEGKGEIYTNQKSVPVQQGDLYLSFPCDLHKLVSDGNSPMKYSFLSFCLTSDGYKDKFEQITQNFHEAEKRIFHNPTVTFLIEQLIGEMMSAEFEKERLVSLTLQQILILIVREFLHNQAKTVSNFAKKDEILCYKIMRHIDNNIFSIQNLTEIAEHFNYNYSYLAKLFKQTTNNTITKYFSEKKLERAKSLIREGDLTFTKIAELLNYASIYSFSKSFKAHFGISPAEYNEETSEKRIKKQPTAASSHSRFSVYKKRA